MNPARIVSVGLTAGLLGGCAAGRMLRAGDPAPQFRLPQTNGSTFALSERAGHWTVLYCYPKDGTPGCTRQACAFRDAIAPIRARDCEVYGVSTDSVESHARFSREHELTFPLLSDEDGNVARAYGADGLLGFSKRWTFLIDPSLHIRWIQRDVDPALNPREVLDQLR